VARHRRSNCLLVALWLWWRRGGYLAIRRSHHYPGWHWLWTPDIGRNCLHWQPPTGTPVPKLARVFFWKLWFKGRLKRGDSQ
jgi:hypothetical protein